MTTTILSETRVFPKNRGHGNPKTVPLSIIDSTVAYYGPTTAIWFFSSKSNPQQKLESEFFNTLTRDLTTSLTHTLSSFPQWTGLLHYTNTDPNPQHPGSHNHTQRYRRLALTYGKETDPGVSVTIAASNEELDTIVPDAASRRKSGAWNGTHIPVSNLIPPRSCLSLGNMKNPKEDKGKGEGQGEEGERELPCVMVQITGFLDGGVAVAVRSSHAVADSISLCFFFGCWGKSHRCLFNSGSKLESILGNGEEQREVVVPKYEAVFNPSLLDQAASGDIDAETPDEYILSKALTLPMPRYDSWNTPNPSTNLPHSIPTSFTPSKITLQTPLPQDDPSSPPNPEISFYVLHFSHEEIERMWEDANSGEEKEVGRVSHHDALCAHIWICINRSRGIEEADKGDVHLDFTIGLRTRTSPPLPPTFLGSPCIMADITLKTHDVSATSDTYSNTLQKVSRKIRIGIQEFNSPGIVGAVLHQKAFDECPQRYYHSWTGRRHVIQTSWLGNGAYDVDFGGESGLGELRWAMAAMAMIDGFMQTMEAAPFDEDEVSREEGGEEGNVGGKKGNTGIDVSLRLEKRAMEKLLVDSFLRRYRS